MPATGSQRTRRPGPSAGVREIRRRPRRRRRSDATDVTAATGIVHAASSSENVLLYREYAIAAGIVATPTRPSSTARTGRLLLCVRTANSCRWNRAADDAGDR